MSIALAQTPLAWYRADYGVTMDVNRKVSGWADAGPNHWDLTTAWTPADQATYTPNVFGTVPALLFPQNAPAGSMDYIDPRGGAALPHLPFDDGAPRMILALVKQHAAAPTNGPGGIVCAIRRNTQDLEFGCWTNGGRQMPCNNVGQWAQFDVMENYDDVTNVFWWTWYGATASTPLAVRVNGKNKTYTTPAGTLDNDTGNNGFSIGGAASFGGNRNYAGYISEVVLYPGSDLTVGQAAETYLMRKGGVLSNGHPPLGGVGPTGHMFRYAPKAFGDVYRNPGQTS